ncbi:hypothetical protein PINS_up006568 [Pythium insidiosum]|nr:hypothetical protein PINS_up006568 [Pythium insidiosum]
MQQVQLLALGLIILGCGSMTLRSLSLSSADHQHDFRLATPVQLLGGHIRRVTMSPQAQAKEKQEEEDDGGRPEPQHDVGEEEGAATRPMTPPPPPPPPTIAWHRATARSSSPTPLLPPSPPPPPARGSQASPPPVPFHWSRPSSGSMCHRERDLGLIDALQSSVRTFCDHSSSDTSSNSATRVSILEAPGGLRASLWRDVVLDLSRARARSPIQSLAQDGGGHDPRFRLDSVQLYCACDELAAFAATQPRPLRLWDPTLAYPPSSAAEREPAMTLCTGNNTQRPQALLSVSPVNSSDVLVLREPTLLMARRDDHNPFFQVSSALNAWILLRALQWRTTDVRVVQLDGGYASPVDALAQRLLSPRFAMLGASELMGKRLHLAGDVLLPPFESSGPMMQHLNDHEPCQQSELFLEFRREALAALGANVSATSDSPVMVTVISRRHYGGRIVHRRWRNEDEILDQAATAVRERDATDCLSKRRLCRAAARAADAAHARQRRRHRNARRWARERALDAARDARGRDLSTTPSALGVPQFVSVHRLRVARVPWRRRPHCRRFTRRQCVRQAH